MVLGQPPYSNWVFMPLSDAITAWESSEEVKTCNYSSKINVLATVVKWGTEKQSKGMNTLKTCTLVPSHCLQGSDMHISATLMDAHRTIKASFFFDRKKILKRPDVGENVRLIGTHLQKWKRGLQLNGKNVQFGESIVSVSLSNAITAWGVVKKAGGHKYFPKLTMLVVVIAWGHVDTCRGD